jgi:predicted O-methyltransferase YrrM
VISLPELLAAVAAVVAVIVVFKLDLRRRRLSFLLAIRTRFLAALDVLMLASLGASITGFVVFVAARLALQHSTDNAARWLLAAIVLFAIACFAWREGWRQIQFQRPDGIVFGECLVLKGGYVLLDAKLFESSSGGIPGAAIALGIACTIVGGALIAIIVPRFLRRREEHRIIERVSQQGEATQSEYTPPTPECPHPDRWRMLDSMTAEVEVLDFLKSLVITLKPELVVETGTFMGLSAIKIAEGMQQNGFGRIITCEFDPVVFQKARERIENAGLANWIECRNQSSLDMQISGTIDIFFSDSDINIREQEIRKFLPQISPNGLVLTHDASSHYKVVRDAALRLEAEGLLSVVLVPTPRGLVIAQKRAGRV